MFSPSSIAATVSEFVPILEPEVGAIANLTGANQQLVDKITAGLEGLKTSAAALATADSAAEQGGIAQRIVVDGEAVLNALTALPLPPQLAAPVRIASMIFGFLPAIVGLIFPVKSVPVAAPPAA